MDLSAVIIVALGILIFFGGAAWLEIHSRRSNRLDLQDAQPQQPNDVTMPARRTADRRVAGWE